MMFKSCFTIVKIIDSDGNKLVFNNNENFNSNKKYALNTGSYKFIHTNRRSNSNYWTCRIGQIGPVQIYSGSSRRTGTEIRIF